MLMSNLSELDQRAVDNSVAIVSKVSADDLALPTPCAQWDLAQLLAHMTAQHRGFAAAARGAGGDLSMWRTQNADDPVAAYRAAADDVVVAFAETGVLQRDFALPEFGPDFVAPGSMAIGFHLVDYVVHGWDVARAVGAAYEVDEELAATALEIARAVPDDAARLRPGAPFAPAIAERSSDPLAQILTLLGRSPRWSAARDRG